MRNELNQTDLFSSYADILEDIDATKSDAVDRMWELCETQVTNYTSDYIISIFALNLVANQKKYEDLIELYSSNIHPFFNEYEKEEYEHTRTPELQSQSFSSGSGTADSLRNQSMITTHAPGETSTTENSVNPYDNSGLRSESKTVTTEGGSGTTTQSFSGDPDHTTTTSNAAAAVSTTGKDTNKYEKERVARKGLTSEIIEDGLKAAAYRDVLDIIINDLAEQIFLQMWL